MSGEKAGAAETAAEEGNARVLAHRLEQVCGGLRSTLVAYSGGVDSAVVLAAAVRALGSRAVGIMALSPSFPEWERQQARQIAATLGARVVEVQTHELEDPRYTANHADRCYFCKGALFDVCEQVRVAEGLDTVCYGANVDDMGQDDRPGQRAAEERGVVAPLVLAGLTKQQVRAVARYWGLSCADKPATACLASRFAHGTSISEERLRQVGQAERALQLLGFSQVRVRFHGEVARIELTEAEMPRLLEPTTRVAAVEGVRAAGFQRVTLDLAGYRTGGADKLAPSRLRVLG